MRGLVILSLFLLAATPAGAWNWDVHYRVAVAAGIPSAAAHGVSFPDMMRPHSTPEGARHYMNADFFPAAYPLGAMPISYATFAAQVSDVDKMGTLLYEILHYAAEYRRDRARLSQGDFNENLLRLAHYVADLYMPLHLTRNYDGQESGQSGAHERIEQYADAMITRVHPAPASPISSDAELWRRLQAEALRNRALVAKVLAADAAAQHCNKPYDQCFAARKLIQEQADRAAGFLAVVRNYLDRPGGELPSYAHRE